LDAYADLFNGTTVVYNGITIETTEGTTAVTAAKTFLTSQTALATVLIRQDGMDKACKDHVEDNGPKGRISHIGSDNSAPEDRLSRYGIWEYKFGEMIGYRFSSANDILMQLIIGDGDSLRRDRSHIFSTDFKKISMATGSHKDLTKMQVIAFA